MVLFALLASAAATVVSPPPADCVFQGAGAHWQGACGPLFDETPTFSIAPENAITTGRWRDNEQPVAAWAGVQSSAGDPDFPVEIEIHAGGAGILRTEFGWYAISGFAATPASVRFRIDTPVQEIPPSELDRRIIERAAAILTSDAVWNRADNRQCAPAAVTWSIYCAMARATIDVTGAFHRRRPALELVRKIVDERTAGRAYDHRLMDYNNDPSTHLGDVRSLFAEALARIPK
jgi:hypothetical protein